MALGKLLNLSVKLLKKKGAINKMYLSSDWRSF